MSDPLTSLVKKIDQQVDTVTRKAGGGLGTYVIFVDNAEGLDKKLQAMAEKDALKHVTLGIGSPPPVYEVSGDAALTVVIYNVDRRGRQNVKANFALRKGELDETKSKAIVKALAEVLAK
jgi:hypothetical protein